MIDFEKAAEMILTVLLVVDTTLNIAEKINRRRNQTSKPDPKKRRNRK